MLRTAQKFKTEIRRAERQRIRAQKRKQFHRLQFGCPPMEEILQSLKLEPANYTLDELIDLRRQDLLNEELSLQQKFGKAFMLNQNEQKKYISLEGHLNFWCLAVYQLILQKYHPTEYFFQFLANFIMINSYRNICFNKTYEIKVINTMDLSAVGNMPKKLKNKMISWVEGTQGLSLIQNCVSHQYYNVNHYSNLYELLLKGLNMESKLILKSRQTALQCVKILGCICKNADYDDLYNISYNFPTLINELSNLMLNNLEDKDIVQNGTDTIIYLLGTYSETILEMAKQSVAFLSGNMIGSQNQVSILKGLQILRNLAETQSYQMISFLTDDRQFAETGVWQKLKVGKQLYTHPTISIRRQAFAIMANLLVNGNYSQILKIIQYTSTEDENIIDLMHYAFSGECGDHQIIENYLSIISILLFYGQQHKNECNQPLRLLQQNNLEKYIERLMQNQNQQLREKCQVILSSIQQSSQY